MTLVNITTSDFKNMVTLRGNDVITTSLKVAEYFDKRHSDILRRVKQLMDDCSPEFSERNFALASYFDEQGKKRPMYNITKDGWILLVMGFTGKAAMQIKESYILAFNWMADHLNSIKLSYEAERNAVMLEFMKEKDVASMSGRLLNRWGRQKKPALLARIKKLEDQGQISLLY